MRPSWSNILALVYRLEKQNYKQSEDPKSDKGIEISKLEKKEIMEAIKNLEDKIMKIKITVDQK
tara:strand:+ start:329 stop:520 length:192 start_codon:yes stop_codon:yes gene_type:complete